jgi:hypothetical protein
LNYYQYVSDKETTVTDEENSSDEDDEQSDGQCNGAEPSRLSVVSPPRSEPTVKPRYGNYLDNSETDK